MPEVQEMWTPTVAVKVSFRVKGGKTNKQTTVELFLLWNFTGVWTSSAQKANDYFIGLHIKWHVFPQLVRAIRVTDKMAEDPLILKQEAGMMLTKQLWSISSGCTWVLRIAAVKHGFPGIMWPRECVLLLNYYSLGQPELRQNNIMAQTYCTVIMFSFPYVSQELGKQGREKICIAWWVWYTVFGDKYSKTFICFRRLALCLRLYFISACSFSGTVLFISTSFGKQKIALLGPFNHDLFHMSWSLQFSKRR